jgi:hypothetical protein
MHKVLPAEDIYNFNPNNANFHDELNRMPYDWSGTLLSTPNSTKSTGHSASSNTDLGINDDCYVDKYKNPWSGDERTSSNIRIII